MVRLCAPVEARRCGALLALAQRVEAADGHDPLDARVRRALLAPGPDVVAVCAQDRDLPGVAVPAPAAAVVVSGPIDEAGTRLGGLLLDPGLDPATRRAVTAALAHHFRTGAAPVAATTTLWVGGDDRDRDRALADAGWRVARRQLRMEVALPVAPPERVPGVMLRPYRPGIDDEALLAVNNRAFAGHPDQGGWTRARLAAALVADAGFRPRDLLVAVVDTPDGSILGFCWTVLHPGADASPRGTAAGGPVGEIHVIGVDPPAQGRGVGRFLVLAGLAHLHDRGARTGMLYVAADNPAAIALYRAIGFRPVRAQTAFVTGPR